jgi:nondiscriminating glutamyl-tRNA synthetase
MTEKKVRTRFAPSPTGYLHIGSLRTALYSYALAKNSGGDFILRIEDTDQKREVKGAVDSLQLALKKFGISWDEFYIQSQRRLTGIYEKAAMRLVNDGHAFYCNCKPRNAKEEGYSTNLRDVCRDKNLTTGAIRLKVPDNQRVSYFDFVHKKEISWNTNEVYDATLLKSDGFPTYHLAAMVDDLDMKISHILRGHDWLPSTPIHLLVFDYLGGEKPQIGHLTDILSAETGKKLSKRRDSVFVEQFLEQGFLPAALLNFVMLLGWAPKDNREIFTLEDFVRAFDIKGFQEANPRFLEDKLLWMNSQYIQKMTDKEFAEKSSKFAPDSADKEFLIKIAPLVKSRIKKLSELKDLVEFFFEEPQVDKEMLGENWEKHISVAREVVSNLRTWKLEDLNDALMKEIGQNNFQNRKLLYGLAHCNNR